MTKAIALIAAAFIMVFAAAPAQAGMAGVTGLKANADMSAPLVQKVGSRRGRRIAGAVALTILGIAAASHADRRRSYRRMCRRLSDRCDFGSRRACRKYYRRCY